MPGLKCARSGSIEFHGWKNRSYFALKTHEPCYAIIGNTKSESADQMPEPTKKIHQHDTVAGSGFRFLTEVIAWVTGTWVAGLVHPILGVLALIVMVGLPTVFTTTGDKKHRMVESPGPLRALIDFFQFAVAALAPWYVLPNWIAVACVAIVVAAIFFGRERLVWLFRGAPLQD